MADPVIRIEQLTKRFSDSEPLALNGISAAIAPNKITGIVGPDGAGKTTLLRLMAGLLLPTEGALTVFGLSPFTEPEQVHSVISYMPQKFGLYEELSVAQNLDLYTSLQDGHDPATDSIKAELLDLMGLAPFQKRLAKNLSGGMKQKLGVMCSLLKKPKLLILDEATVGIDPTIRQELWKLMRDLTERQVTVVWSTTYLDEAEKCDDVLLLNEGNLLYKGPPKQLIAQVAGRVYAMHNITQGKHALFQKTKQHPAVLDSVIRGDAICILLKDKPAAFSLSDLPTEGDSLWEEAEPHFEEAFIDMLGGGPHGTSPLAASVPVKSSSGAFAIEVNSLTKTFGAFNAVSEISFAVKRGEIFGLIGPNGAGKSTTFRMLCGLIKPTAGKAAVNGVSLLQAAAKARAQIGYMAQKFSLYGNMTVLQNLRFFAGIYPMNGRSREEAINEMVDIFSLSHYLDTPAERLPLGYKQRLALSCSLMHRPEVIFLDEATSGVDPVTRREFWNHIQGLVARGATVMVTTHYMDEVYNCDRIGFIVKGQMIKIDTPHNVVESVKSVSNPNPSMEEVFIALSRGGSSARD